MAWRNAVGFLRPGFHIVVSDGDVPASTGTWRRCIGDILKSWIDLDFSRLDWDVGDTTGTSMTSPKNRSHIIVNVPVASPFHWLGRVPVTYDDMETRLKTSFVPLWKIVSRKTFEFSKSWNPLFTVWLLTGKHLFSSVSDEVFAWIYKDLFCWTDVKEEREKSMAFHYMQMMWSYQ